MKLCDRKFGTVLLLLVAPAICGALAHQYGRTSEAAQYPAGQQNTSEIQHVQGGENQRAAPSVNGPFDPGSQASVGNVVGSPFDSAPELTEVGAVNDPFQSHVEQSSIVASPFDVQSEDQEGPEVQPSSSAGETEMGVKTPVSHFEASLKPPAEAEDDDSPAPSNEITESVSEGKNADVPGRRRDQPNAAEENETFPLQIGSGPEELFGGGYVPRLSGDAAPAFSDARWTPWYSLQVAGGHHSANAEVAFNLSGEVVQGGAHNRHVSWVLRSRNQSTLTLEYQLNIHCAENCQSGWRGYRAVIPAGRSVSGGESELWQIHGMRLIKADASAGKKTVGKT